MYRYEEVTPRLVYSEGLTAELRSALPSTFARDRITYDSSIGLTHISVWVTEILSDDQEAALRAAIEAHDSSGWQVRIADLCISPLEDPFSPPIDLDFTVGLKSALQKVNTKVWQGDILQTIYYESISAENVPCKPVVQWDTKVVYSPTYIDVYDTISWVLNNGQLHPLEKHLHQRYSGQRWLDWLEGKRSQIIAWLRYNVAASMMTNLIPEGWSVSDIMLEGGQFFKDHGAVIATYIAGADPTAITDIQADDRTWLDGLWYDKSMTIRAKFLEQMSY